MDGVLMSKNKKFKFRIQGRRKPLLKENKQKKGYKLRILNENWSDPRRVVEQLQSDWEDWKPVPELPGAYMPPLDAGPRIERPSEQDIQDAAIAPWTPESGTEFEDYMLDVTTGEKPEYAGIRPEPETRFEDYMLDIATGEDPEYAGIRAELPEPPKLEPIKTTPIVLDKNTPGPNVPMTRFIHPLIRFQSTAKHHSYSDKRGVMLAYVKSIAALADKHKMGVHILGDISRKELGRYSTTVDNWMVRHKKKWMDSKGKMRLATKQDVDKELRYKKVKVNRRCKKECKFKIVPITRRHKSHHTGLDIDLPVYKKGSAKPNKMQTLKPDMLDTERSIRFLLHTLNFKAKLVLFDKQYWAGKNSVLQKAFREGIAAKKPGYTQKNYIDLFGVNKVTTAKMVKNREYYRNAEGKKVLATKEGEMMYKLTKKNKLVPFWTTPRKGLLKHAKGHKHHFHVRLPKRLPKKKLRVRKRLEVEQPQK